MAFRDVLGAAAQKSKGWLTPRILAFLLVALANLKVLPFAWHIRIIYAYWGHYAFGRRGISPSTAGSLTLFQPTIYTTSMPTGELDYNMHKSNSTYLTDLDVARGYHIYSIFRVGTRDFTRRGKAEGTFAPALGGVSLSFRRPIGPFEKYDIWTRVLSWDSKWFYLISHFVPAGAVAPAIFSDQPHKAGTASTVARPSVYAASVARIVMKQGRKTIPPEEFLRACKVFGDSGRAGTTMTATELRAVAEKQRLEGLHIAQSLAALDGAFDWRIEDEKVAFARY